MIALNVDNAKWEAGMPVIDTRTLPSGKNQSISNNPGEDPCLWVIGDQAAELNQLFLRSRCINKMPLNSKSNPVSSSCHPSIVSYKKYVAVCSENLMGDNEIDVYKMHHSRGGEKQNPSYVAIFSDLKRVAQQVFNGKFLYALGRDASNQSQLLQYDSVDFGWKSKIIPKKLSLAEDTALKFYVAENEIFFLGVTSEGKYQVSAVDKNACFEEEKPRFFKSLQYETRPLLKVVNDAFLAIVPGANSSSEKPLAVVEQLHLEGSEMTKRCLGTIRANAAAIMDFYVHCDKIFTLAKGDEGLSVCCYNVANGKRIWEIFAHKYEYIQTDFEPVLDVQPPKIRVYYNAGDYKSLVTAEMSLDFSK